MVKQASQKGNKRLFVVVVDEPDHSTGALRSAFSSLYQEFQTVSQIRLNHLLLESERNSPLVFVEKAQQNSALIRNELGEVRFVSFRSYGANGTDPAHRIP